MGKFNREELLNLKAKSGYAANCMGAWAQDVSLTPIERVNQILRWADGYDFPYIEMERPPYYAISRWIPHDKILKSVFVESMADCINVLAEGSPITVAWSTAQCFNLLQLAAELKDPLVLAIPLLNLCSAEQEGRFDTSREYDWEHLPLSYALDRAVRFNVISRLTQLHKAESAAIHDLNAREFRNIKATLGVDEVIDISDWATSVIITDYLEGATRKQLHSQWLARILTLPIRAKYSDKLTYDRREFDSVIVRIRNKFFPVISQNDSRRDDFEEFQNSLCGHGGEWNWPAHCLRHIGRPIQGGGIANPSPTAIK